MLIVVIRGDDDCSSHSSDEVSGIKGWFGRWFDGDGCGKGHGSAYERPVVLIVRDLPEGGVGGIVAGFGGGGFSSIFFFGCPKMCFKGGYGTISAGFGSPFPACDGE